MTVLKFAFGARKIEVVKLLLENKAEVNAANKVSNTQWGCCVNKNIQADLRVLDSELPLKN